MFSFFNPVTSPPLTGCGSPLLTRQGYGLTWREGIVLVWGGLRGAVGLALALIVERDTSIPKEIRERCIPSSLPHLLSILTDFSLLYAVGFFSTWLALRD